MQGKEAILRQIKRSVLQTDPSAQLILFGSQARGDAHEESDRDVLVVTGQEVAREYKSRMRRKFYGLQSELGIAVGNLFVNRQKCRQPTAMPVYLEIRKDGILL